MAIAYSSEQFTYKGRGPLDAKALIKTYAKILSEDTWTIDGTVMAYNGMLVSVWLDKNTDGSFSDKNGVYFLYDPNVTSAIGDKSKPDVTNEANWHKLASADELADRIAEIENRVTALEEEESDVLTYELRAGFPLEGEADKLYVAADEQKSYVWFNGNYLPVSDSSDDDIDIQIIHGGSASTT